MSRIRSLLHDLADAVADHLEEHVEAARYYDQESSPLPAAAHCRLVRTGVLKGFKRAGRVFVERTDMHRFIEAGAVVPRVSVAVDEDAELERVLANLRKAG